MNKRLAARLPGSGGLMSDDGLPLDVAVTRKPSPLTNGSGGPSLPLLIARGTDAVPYELLRKPMKMEGGSPTGPGSPPDTSVLRKLENHALLSVHTRSIFPLIYIRML